MGGGAAEEDPLRRSQIGHRDSQTEMRRRIKVKDEVEGPERALEP
jgi:hypothetical protein